MVGRELSPLIWCPQWVLEEPQITATLAPVVGRELCSLTLWLLKGVRGAADQRNTRAYDGAGAIADCLAPQLLVEEPQITETFFL